MGAKPAVFGVSLLGLIPIGAGDPAPQPAQPAPEAAPATAPAVPPAPAAPEALPPPEAAAAPPVPAPRAAATKAASQSVTISDFQFSRGTITVTAGEAITFTNDGPTPHSATADGGSFDTGILSAGKSKTEEFDAPGTYPFHCAPHPFMKATVRVLAASGSGESSGPNEGSGSGPAEPAEPSGGQPQGNSPAPSGNAPSPSPSGDTGPRASSSAGNLAFTGANLVPLAILGVALIAAGAIGIGFSRARAAACDR